MHDRRQQLGVGLMAGKRAIENRLEKAEAATPGDDDVPPATARVRDPIIEEHGHDAYMEVLTAIVLTILDGPTGRSESRARTEAGWPDPAPESDETAWPSEAARDEAINDLARAWSEANDDTPTAGGHPN